MLLLAAAVAVVTSSSTPTPITHTATRDELTRYPWLTPDKPIRSLEEALPAPPGGYMRVPATPGSFAAWLRGLPLRPAGTAVKAFDGRTLRFGDDPSVAAVVELDVGARGWQQCSDSIIRLHAEWLWSMRRASDAAYRLTSGEKITWPAYARGERAHWNGTRIVWRRTRADASRTSFRRFLELVFLYGGTRSLASEGRSVSRAAIAPGDFFVWPGSAGHGHAVLVLDVAVAADGRRVALIGQGYTPAQDFHVLSPGTGMAWFSLDGESVATPHWPAFTWLMLRRW